MIVSIELVIFMKIYKLVDIISTWSRNESECADEMHEGFSNECFYWLHIDRFIQFLIQDIIFGSIWLTFRDSEDMYQLYSEMRK